MEELQLAYHRTSGVCKTRASIRPFPEGWQRSSACSTICSLTLSMRLLAACNHEEYCRRSLKLAVVVDFEANLW